MIILQLCHTSMEFEPPIVALGDLLATNGCTVVCVAYWKNELPLIEWRSSNYVVIRIRRGDFSWLPRIVRGSLRLTMFWLGVVRVAYKWKPDVLISYNYDTLPLAAALRRKGRTLVYYCTEYSPRATFREYVIGWGFLKSIEAVFVKLCDHIVCVERKRATLHELQWGRSVDEVLFNSPLYDHAYELKVLTAIQSDGQSLRCVYTGGLNSENCIPQLFAAFDHDSAATLDIYGRVYPGFAQRFEELLAQSRAVQEGRIRYIGLIPYDSVRVRLLDYDVGLTLYDNERINTALASPAKLFEYMRAGLAIVSTDQPTPIEVITDAECGWILAAPSLDGLGAVLKDLTGNREKLRRTRLNAVQAFGRKYAYEKQAESLLGLICGQEQSHAMRTGACKKP